MAGKPPLRIAVTGIDGAGKSVVIDHLKARWSKKRRVGSMQIVPNPKGQKGAVRVVQSALRRVAEQGDRTGNKSFIAASQALQSALLPFLRVGVERGKDVMLFERHPRIDYDVYASVYGRGRKAAKLAKLIASVPMPDIIIHLDAAPSVAFDRIMKSRRRLVNQIHESPESLAKARGLLKEAVGRAEQEGVRVVRINANASKSEMLKAVRRKLRESFL